MIRVSHLKEALGVTYSGLDAGAEEGSASSWLWSSSSMSSVHTIISGAISEIASDEIRLDGDDVVEVEIFESDIRLSGA